MIFIFLLLDLSIKKPIQALHRAIIPSPKARYFFPPVIGTNFPSLPPFSNSTPGTNATIISKRNSPESIALTDLDCIRSLSKHFSFASIH